MHDKPNIVFTDSSRRPDLTCVYNHQILYHTLSMHRKNYPFVQVFAVSGIIEQTSLWLKKSKTQSSLSKSIKLRRVSTSRDTSLLANVYQFIGIHLLATIWWLLPRRQQEVGTIKPGIIATCLPMYTLQPTVCLHNLSFRCVNILHACKNS